MKRKKKLIVLVYEKGLIVATDKETGVTSQGTTEAEALRNLAEALELFFQAES